MPSILKKVPLLNKIRFTNPAPFLYYISYCRVSREYQPGGTSDLIVKLAGNDSYRNRREFLLEELPARTFSAFLINVPGHLKSASPGFWVDIHVEEPEASLLVIPVTLPLEELGPLLKAFGFLRPHRFGTLKCRSGSLFAVCFSIELSDLGLFAHAVECSSGRRNGKA